MHRLHHGVENILHPRQLRDRLLLRRGHHFVRCALRDDASGVEHNHALAQGEYFLPAVRHIEDGNVVNPVPLPQIVDDLRLRRCVERGQRFVEKQHSRVGHQRSRQSRALTFSTGNRAGTALRQMSNVKCLKNRRRAIPALRPRQMRQAVFNVLLHRQMRKQRESLKDVSDTPLRHRKIGTLRRIKQDAVANGDASRLRLSQSGNAVEQGCLSRSRRAEQDRESRRSLKLDVQNEMG